jgi:hypothetical protein
LLPERIRDDLDLTEQQAKQLADLEKEVKERLFKILTTEQKKKLDELRQRGPGGPPPGGPGRPPEREGRPELRGPGGPPPGGPDRPDREEARTDSVGGGIQWFATWESGLREAERSGRPILLVSAAPHCAGVSGCW